MPDDRARQCLQVLGAVEVCRDINLDDRRGEFVTLLGLVGLRQDDDAQHDRRPRGGDLRRHPDGRPAGQRSRADRARRRHGVPELRALSAHDGGPEHRLHPEAARARRGRDRRRASRRRPPRSSSRHLLDRFPSQLSGGQQQRVAIGRAMVREPKVFLFDEPFSNLDAALRKRMRAEVKELHSRLGVTSIFVTHDQEEAMSISDRIAVMRQGASSSSAHRRRSMPGRPRPMSPRFIGNPQIDILPAEIVEQAGQSYAVCGDGEVRPECGAVGGPPGSTRARSIYRSGPSMSDSAVRGIPANVRDRSARRPVDDRQHSPGPAARAVARLNGIVRIAVGSTVHAMFDTRHLMFFDRDSGRRISIPG